MKPCSWSLQPPSNPAAVRPIHWMDQAAERVAETGPSRLAFGQGRSYGDVCLNNGGALIPTAGLNRILAYHRASGVITAEAGVTFDQIIRLVAPDGWFTPVTPGTRHLTLGGAVANDVHGKEHISQGTFGRHIRGFVLWRSGDGRLVCSPGENLQVFRATIGGMGLTGLITEVTFQLRAIAGTMIEAEHTIGDCVDAGLFHRSDYAVAWLDASAATGRGVMTNARFVPGASASPRKALQLPAVFPSGLLNRRTLGALNRARWALAPRRAKRELVSYERFFHPLDRLGSWNRVFGARGFYQHQSVIPQSAGGEPIRELLRALRRGGGSSFVSVLKAFGPLESPGMLSFPREGLTLALDLPNAGRPTLGVLDTLDEIVLAAGGRLYPAKDARMNPATFRAGYPRWEQFAKYIDPAFSSSFWRRVTAS